MNCSTLAYTPNSNTTHVSAFIGFTFTGKENDEETGYEKELVLYIMEKYNRKWVSEPSNT